MESIQEEKKAPKYFAFISYSSHDKVMATKLQNTLERYRLPTRLRKKYKTVSPRAYPICRDDTHLGGFEVWTSLTKLLDTSKYLIVICSPQSAKSEWVNKEVQYFIDQGKKDKILPFIVEGIPYSNSPETECFPPALRNLEDYPLGADVQALGKRKAYLRAVATLLGVEFEELLMRDTNRRIRKGIACTLLATAAFTISGYTVWHNMEHSKYYNTITYQNEIPVGLYELSKKERSGASDCYRITTKRDKVIRLEIVNSRNVVVYPIFSTTITDYPAFEYQYNEDGNLITILQKDATGMEVMRKELSAIEGTNDILVDFISPSSKLAQALPSDMFYGIIGDIPQGDKSEITRQYNTYDENGHLIQTMYQRNNLGEPACGSNGVFGKAYTYNEQGLVSRISNLDEYGNLFDCKYGWAYEEFLYNEKGSEISSQYYDAYGNKATNQKGYSATATEYDDYENIICLKTLDENGQLTYNSEGYAMEVVRYNEQGLPTNLRYLGPENTPVNESNSIHEIRFEYDTLGRNNAMSYYDIEGKQVYSPTLFCARQEAILDKDGHILEERYFDAQGKPTPNRENNAYGFRYEYDENGIHKSTTCMNAAGEQAMNKYGYTTWSAVRDRDGRIIREEFRDANGMLVRGTENYAAVEYTYDSFGNNTKIQNFDECGNPCYHSFGYCIKEMEYASGKLISERYLDTDGNPTVCCEYYHEIRYEYNEKGNCIRRSYYGLNDEKVNLNNVGYAVIEMKYNKHGNVTEKWYFDAADAPACNKELGVYGIRFTYDKKGGHQKTEYLNANGDLMVGKEGYAFFIVTTDDLGRRLRVECYNASGHLVRNTDNWAIVEYTYDTFGNQTEFHLYDENEDPCYHLDGYSIKKMNYHAGQIISEKYFDTKNQPMMNNDYYYECRSDYDDKGNCIRKSYYDTDGNKIERREKRQKYKAGYALPGQTYDAYYASIENKYDAFGNVIEQVYYSQDNLLNKGMAIYKYEYSYDNCGNILREIRHSTTPEELDYVISESEYDARGNLIKKFCYNESGNPMDTSNSPSQINGEYDPKGNLLQVERLYGSDKDYAVILKRSYDLFGNMILEKHMERDASGKTTIISQTRMSYDAYGNCIRKDFLNGNGSPQMQEEGYASVEEGYSPQGNVIWREYYNETDTPCLYDGEAFRYEYEYTASGLLTGIHRYDTDKMPLTEDTGLAAHTHYARNALGYKTHEWNYNENQALCKAGNNSYSFAEYFWDEAGFPKGKCYYDENRKCILNEQFFVYIDNVYEGSSAYDHDISSNQFIIQLGDWNYFNEYDFSSHVKLKTELSRTTSMEKILVLCEWTTEDTFVFHRYSMPEGMMGIHFSEDMADIEFLKRMEDAYVQWLKDNP